MYSIRYFCPVLMKLEFHDRFSIILKYRENPSGGRRVVPWGKTDGKAWRSW